MSKYGPQDETELSQAFSKMQLHEKISPKGLKLLEAELLSNKFNNKADLHTDFIRIIQSKIVEPIIPLQEVNAPELLIKNYQAQVIKILLDLKEQFTIKDEAREKAVIANMQFESASKELKELEKAASQIQPSAAVTIPEGATSSAKTISPSRLDILREAIEGFRKTAEETKINAEKITDIEFKYKGAFIAFANYALSNPVHLAAITERVIFHKPDRELTENNFKAAEFLANQQAEGRAKRLADVDRGVFLGIVERVTDWYQNIPKALSSEEIKRREMIVPYKTSEDDSETESQDTRERRIAEVAGFTPSRIQAGEKAVAKSKDKKGMEIARSLLKSSRDTDKRVTDFHPIAKQLHELDDLKREEMEQLGIKDIPKNKQRTLSAGLNLMTGAKVWNTDFESRNPHVEPRFSRARLDQELPVLYPERRKLAASVLTPALQRHLQLGVDNGLIDSKTVKPSEGSTGPHACNDMEDLIAKWHKVRL